MTLQSPKILCGQCIVVADLPENPRDTDELRFPACDRIDTVGKAVSDARRHATHMAEQAFERKMEQRGRAFSRRAPTVAPERSLRWISNFSG